jgi:hypothetical protein
MSIDRLDFENVNEQDIRELVGEVSESQSIEFKREMYGKEPDDRFEFLKDVSALANTRGGHLIIGLADVKGLASAVVPLTENADADLRRLEQLSRSGIEPHLPGVRMLPVPVETGYVLVLRVPRSWNPPHRVMPTGQYFMRHSSGTYMPSVQELRELFSQTATALTRARLFRDHRVAEIQNERGDPKLFGNGRLILHIVPLAADPGDHSLDLRAAQQADTQLAPMSQQLGFNARYNYNGFVIERPGQPTRGYTQVFRSGALEATIGDIVFIAANAALGRAIAGYDQERNFFAAYSRYLEALRGLGVATPLALMITLTGVLGARYMIRDRLEDYPPPFAYDMMTLPECLLEDYGEEVDRHRAIRPAFDALWNAAGYDRAQSFDGEGRWQRR